ncbi:MAG: glucosyl-dolichyl phosphate glucuronosyltransferase [Pseudonocardiales bacterium]|nr:glucosyl-dolichyl phosphate glucuronosyltransferase [Pseudonocardiales bacterium]
MTSPAELPAEVAATVVICVYTGQRWDDIVAAVDSVRSQDVAAAEVLVVVDHNPDLLERARHALSSSGDAPVRVLPNTRRQGLSGARNTAVAAATGDVVVFLDDDAAARPGWLAALLAPYADPQVVAVGGVAHPRFPAARPGLLPSGGTGADATGELDWIVGCTYTGQPTERSEVRNLMGCNMSLRRSVFAEVGGFAEDLGRIGRNPLGCEETELCIRVRQAYRRGGREARIVFEPAAQVDHRVGAERVRWSYLRRRSWSEGLSKAAVARLVGSDDALSTERSYVATVLPRAVLRELRAGRPASAAAVLAALGATTAGYLRGRLPGATSQVRLPAAAPDASRRSGAAPQAGAPPDAVPAPEWAVRGTGGA